jgi:hypothetical protein
MSRVYVMWLCVSGTCVDQFLRSAVWSARRSIADLAAAGCLGPQPFADYS